MRLSIGCQFFDLSFYGGEVRDFDGLLEGFLVEVAEEPLVYECRVGFDRGFDVSFYLDSGEQTSSSASCFSDSFSWLSYEAILISSSASFFSASSLAWEAFCKSSLNFLVFELV